MKKSSIFGNLLCTAIVLLSAILAWGCSSSGDGGGSNKYSGAKLLNVEDKVVLTNSETFTLKIFYAKGVANMSSTALVAETSDYKICKVTGKSSAAAGDSCLALITLGPGTDFGEATVKVRFYNIADNAESGEVSVKVVHQEQAEDFFAENIGGEKLTMQFVQGGEAVLGISVADSAEIVNERLPGKAQVATPEFIHERFTRRKVRMEDFYMAGTELTGKLYKAVTGTVLHDRNADGRAAELTYAECWDFIKKLSELTGRNYRMATNDEWEYAAIGGQKTKGYKYPGSNTLSEVSVLANGTPKSVPYTVGQKKPNELGLYDMAGNVEEWVNDTIHSDKNISDVPPEYYYSFCCKGGSLKQAGSCVDYRPWYKAYIWDRYTFQGLRLVISLKDYERNPVK